MATAVTLVGIALCAVVAWVWFDVTDYLPWRPVRHGDPDRPDDD